MRKNLKSNTAVMIVAGLVFLVFLAGSLAFVYGVWRQNEESSLKYLEDATTQRRDAVLQQMQSDFQVLRGVAVTLGGANLADEWRLNRVIDEVNRTNTFIMMGLADLQGKVDLVDLQGQVYPGVDLTSHGFFYQALEGRDAVSETFFDEPLGQFVNYYAVPVRQNGLMVGVLCAVSGEDVLRDIIGVPVFQGEGYFGLVDENGIFVAATTDPHPKVQVGSSLNDVIEAEPGEKRRLRRALITGEEGGFVFDIDGVEQLSVVEPLGINNWSVICAVPHNSINTYYNQTAVGTAIIIVAACVVFLFLLVWQMRSMSKSREDLEHLAYTDLLTGLRNFNKFMLDTDAILKENPKNRYAFWSFDIKKFNFINDIFGSATGDKVLQRAADELNADEGYDTFCCRVAADQFAGIRPYSSTTELREWYWRVCQSLTENRQVIPDNRMRIDTAMGFYCVDEFDEMPPVDDMVNRAVIAKKRAKAKAGSEVGFFTREMGEQLRWESELEAGGESALANGEITFHIQPKVSIQDGFKIIGGEVLARWQHPLHGWVSPGEFIPIFERTGFVVDLDRFIFEEACKWLVAVQKRGMPPIRLSINVSRQGLLRDDFITHYTSVRKRYDIPEKALELEFTESMMLEDYDLFHASVLEIQDKGFLCSIDDFGAGYSSLNVLKNLPIDILKLDAAFFRETADTRREHVVVENFITMAHELGIHTVAEGVESKEQVEFLQHVECDIIQGYVFSKPLRKGDFEELMRTTGGVLTLD